MVVSAVWHDLECGSYEADLPLWRELAAAAGSGRVLDVGAGTGRVALDLARRGALVTAVDIDGELLSALRDRAAATDMAGSVEAVRADARALALERRDFALCVVPMQTIQLLGGRAGRLAFLRCARAHLRPGGVLACAIVTDVDAFDCAAGDVGPSAEVVRVDGASYVSRATRVHVGIRAVRIERERRIGAELERDVVDLDRLSVAQLEGEGREAGLAVLGTRAIAETAEHTASVAVIFRA